MEAQASSTMLGETGKRVAASVSDHWKPPPPSPSRVKVYDEDKLAMLLGDAPPPTHQSVTLGRTRSIHAAMRAQQRSEKRRQAREAEEQRVRRYERHRDEANKRQAEAERAGHKLADEIQQHLSLQEMNARTKLKRQFDEWNDGVYGAIQDQINDRLDGMDSSEINRRRRHEFQKFLDTTNAKGAIFRDIIIESRARVAVRNRVRSEYDPLEPNRNCIKVKTEGIRDPVKRVLDKHHEETSMLDDDGGGDGDGDPLGKTKSKTKRRPRPVVRETLEITSWGAGKIEATPHGCFAKLMDEAKPPAGDKGKSKTFESNIPFDHYNVSVGSAATDKEFPVGKRTHHVPTTIKLA
ncbi:hypothetical protein JL722_12630 [Aureococcus anophagefferens]|nr:hypothetical protein JL722_12630 [Aureococcus anophagefferens]